jgi:hypothetical protein
MTDANPPTPPKAAAPTRAKRVLASLIAGAGLDEIGAAEKLTRKRTEKILRDELRRRWVAPAQEFARLQIARLDSMILKLIERVQRANWRRSTARSRSSTASTAIMASPGRTASPSRMARRSARGSCKRSTTSPHACSRTSWRNERHCSSCSGSAAATLAAASSPGLSASPSSMPLRARAACSRTRSPAARKFFRLCRRPRDRQYVPVKSNSPWLCSRKPLRCCSFNRPGPP